MAWRWHDPNVRPSGDFKLSTYVLTGGRVISSVAICNLTLEYAATHRKEQNIAQDPRGYL
jgi:hypothetical protein